MFDSTNKAPGLELKHNPGLEEPAAPRNETSSSQRKDRRRQIDGSLNASSLDRRSYLLLLGKKNADATMAITYTFEFRYPDYLKAGRDG